MDLIQTVPMARPRDLYLQTHPAFQEIALTLRRRLDSFSRH
jgi:hypothetical protein